MNSSFSSADKGFRKWAGPVVLVLILTGALFWIITSFFGVGKSYSHFLLILGVSISIACAISLFTAELIVSDDDPNRERRIARGVLVIGYMFLIAIACLAFALMFIDYDKTKNENTIPAFLPMLVYGCEYQAPAEPKQSETKENENSAELKAVLRVTIPANLKYCGQTEPQRMLVIGGIKTQCSLTNNCSVVDAPEIAKAEKAITPTDSETPINAMPGANDFYHDQKNCSADIDSLLSKDDPNPCASAELLKRLDSRIKKAGKVADDNNTIRTYALSANPGDESDFKNIAKLIKLQSLVEARIEQKKALDAHYVIDNHVTGNLIIGGIIVPAYFIFCALIGAMIAMARKLPEFQARLKRTEEDTSEKVFRGDSYAPIGYCELPELVLFQIIQVASAPILAVIAYGYLNDDFESQFTGISIAFAAGFSSEWILMMVRSISDRLGGAKPKTVPYRTVTPEAKAAAFIDLKSGRAYVSDTIILIKPVGLHKIGDKFVLTNITGQELTVREKAGVATIIRSADFFDIELEQPKYVSMDDDENNAVG
ncbi:hypothetical protein [Alteromonas confluentis]|uniref:Uncharacterized protein n=1 Tax=Alteromonas confluentis TaxID=1656094 RepID=A0A1E7ZDP6_9ALTE|nr:hypothetical protein [Alteromonas confluentis]OFC71572.1 hypothetical protein BFC18_07505 [Alteromonas confluentis]